MNNELIGIISNEGELKGVVEDNSFNVTVQITETGPRGLQGNDGYTPIKGVDYFDGSDYSHPSSHPASMIEEDIDRNFVTVRQKDNLYGHIHEQIKASKTWVIFHTLDKYPSISIVDSSGNQVIGSPKYIDKNNVVIEFTSEFSGKAYLN